MYKKLCALILCLILIILTATSSFAISHEAPIALNGSVEIALQDGSILVCEEFPNGDAQFLLKKDGVILSQSYARVSASTVQYTDFRSGIPQESTTIVKSKKASANQSKRNGFQSKGYTDAGKINYQYTSGGTPETCSVQAYYDRTIKPSVTYDLNQKYRDYAELASVLTVVLGIPGAFAGLIAQWVVWAFGAVVTSADIVFNNTKREVKATETYVLWKVQNGSDASHNDTFSGYKYVFNANGETKTEKRGSFFAITSITKKNTSFSTRCFTGLFPYTSFSVTSWNPA